MKEFTINTILSVIAGIFSGLYSALIIARYQRFADLRIQVIRIILEIDYMVEGNRINLPRRKQVPELGSIASDLLFLGHKRAGNKILQLSQEIAVTLMLAPIGKICYEEMNNRFTSWQVAVRELSPNKRQLFKLLSGL